MTIQKRHVSKLALAGFLLALLPGVALVADLLWDVTAVMPANRILAAGLGYSLLGITLAGGVTSLWGLIQIKKNQPQFTGVHFARIGIVFTLLNIWFVPHVARVVIREPVDWSRNNCIHNMRQIDNAKEQWAIETGKTEGTPVRMNDIIRYMKDSQVLHCPKGGTYTNGAVNEPPRCSVHGVLWVADLPAVKP
jgi:hypothetical protein